MKCCWCNKEIGLHKWHIDKDIICERCATIYVKNMIKSIKDKMK